MTSVPLGHGAAGDVPRRASFLRSGPGLVVIVGLVALAVFTVGAWIPAYRLDEYLVAVARTHLSWPRLVDVIATSDPGPGPWYLLMKPWADVSTDPWWTRLPSVVAMTIAVGTFVAFVRRAVDTRVAILAAVVAIALPGMSRWAEDNRMYAAATAFLVIALYGWWRSIRGGTRRWSVLYAIAVGAMGLAHLYTLAWLPVFGIAALWAPVPRRDALVRTIVPALIAVLVISPQIALNLLHPTGTPMNPELSLHTLGDVILNDIGRFLGVFVVALGIAGAVSAWRTPDRRAVAVLGLAWALVPLVEFAAARVLIGLPTLVDRYYVFAMPGVALLAGLGLDAVYRRWRIGVAIAIVVLVALALPDQLAARAVDGHDPEIYHLGQVLRQPELAGLPVATSTPHMREVLDTATFPGVVPPAGPATSPVAIYLSRPPTAREEAEAHVPSPYVSPGTAWRSVVRCTFGASAILDVLALPTATIPAGDPATLATRLHTEVPGAACEPR